MFSSLLTRSFVGLRCSPRAFLQIQPMKRTFYNYSVFQPSSKYVQPRLQIATAKSQTQSTWHIATTIGTLGAGIGLSLWMQQQIHCDSKPPPSPVDTYTPRTSAPPPPPPPESIVNVYELTFGTVAGICAGVFIKKGFKALAFLFGGIFVFLQYLGAKSIVHVDWSRVSNKFEHLFYSTDALTGARKPPTVYSLWRWLVDFLTADFQPRASFIAGLMLGLRIG